ncbi:Histidine kinase-like ATPase, ATP-binding domain-containing protein [Cynara cardunculus var. scolymus]|uniref:Histidine kinase-like ATPase, ATP-binding domain-containing protein n=1 Tax=Cynara cardunculus var. scolymus TaxID=59895 RepID=A0A124SFX9_CYNCS|nr:Histidine kinase-like ATPase, ATP-binding domain-containing protein [Cynara cardunculus var. scolymus]
MWDLTPDTELLMELPEEYTFETALADLIDNSLQAVWSNGENEKRLISVEVADDKISIVDTGPGMDSMGKMGASLHRASKIQAVGGKPPYLKVNAMEYAYIVILNLTTHDDCDYLLPAFGMFGYGGFVASMHLGRHTEVSSKTKNCKKVYILRLERDALVGGSGSKRTWRVTKFLVALLLYLLVEAYTYGSLRDPMEDELELSPGGSFTKVDIFEPKMRSIDIRRLQCKLKDIYFPYIQVCWLIHDAGMCDELSNKGRTTMPIEFQVSQLSCTLLFLEAFVNGDDLAEIPGGEVAITNLNSCNSPEFVLQLRFHLNHKNATMTSSQDEANARLRCVYLPVKEGKESIQSILETLKEDGYEHTEEYESFSHVSCRRLGRLLPDARWVSGFKRLAWLPFMDFRQNKGDRSQVLKRSCMRVKCFIALIVVIPETDAGFNPTSSKTNFAHQNPYTNALRNLGSRDSLEKETGVHIEIRRDGKPLTLSQLNKQYQQWLLDMHDKYDKEADCGTDEPVYIVNPIKTKELHTSRNVVRVHKALRWKGKSWKSGQRIKILKGACAGFHKTNVYATMEYILLEGFQGDAGGESIDTLEEDGCLLETIKGNPILDLRKSVSIHINAIDSGKCLAVDDAEWNQQLQKQHQKSPSSIEILTRRQCRELGIEVSLPDEREVCAGHVSPCEIVAVVRPATFNSGTASKHLDQKYVMKDKFEMSLAIAYSGNEKLQDESNIYSALVTPSSRRDVHGLYVFQPNCKSHPLFHKAGIYTFSLSIKCVVKVQVKASREAHRWAPSKEIPYHLLTVGRYCEPISVVKFDKYDNQIPFLEVSEVEVKVNCTEGTRVQVLKYNPSTSSDKSALILKSSTLDNIRPSYDATLMLSLPDGSHLLDILVKVVPGPVKHVTVRPEICEKQLIPGHLFDAHRNHLQEKQKVLLGVDGCCFPDGSYCLQKKVDARGCIDLGGLLRVTAGYGRKVFLSVSSDGGVIHKEWQIEKRQLRTTSVIPESCFAGSKLENLEFEVVNPKGEVDVNFHDEDKIGQSHTLVITSQFIEIDESVKYVFRDGRCIVRAVPIPSEEGDFSFVVSHSRHVELQLTIKVYVEIHPEMKPFNIIHELPPEMTPLNIKHLSTDENMALVDSNAPMDAQTDYRSVQCHTPETKLSPIQDVYYDFQSDLRSCLNFEKDLMNEICDLGLRIGQHEDKIKQLECQKSAIDSELLELEVIRYQTYSTERNGIKYGSPGKMEIKAQVELKTDSAASVVMELLREESSQSFKRIIGVVALLGTTPTLELSRIFAEYLGDQMLAVVCKNYKDVRFLETYKKNGRLDHNRALHMLAAGLGKSVIGRYHLLCIEDISACKVDKDLEGKLMLPNPSLPDGATPAGFVGYAVNMIDIDVDHLDTRTDSGSYLRETLFYRLFGETQVYKTRQDMKNAISCIKDGAVSLDGGIFRGNGAMSLGFW